MPANKNATASRMKEIRDRKAAIRQELKPILALMQDRKDQMATATMNGALEDSQEFRNARAAVATAAPLQDELKRLEQEEHFHLNQMAGMSPNLNRDSFLSDPAVLTELASLSESTRPIGPNTNLGMAVSRDELVFNMNRNAAGTGTPGFPDYSGAGTTAPVRPGVIPPLYRQLRLLDVLPTETMEMAVIPYVQQIPDYGTAVEVANLALKPESGLELIDQEARATTIAHWIKLSRLTLADFSGLQQAIQTQLIQGVNQRVEYQVVNGDGEGLNMLGILNQTGVGEVEYSAGALEADQTLQGVTTVMNSNAYPSAVLVSPNDWQNMLLAKSSGSGEYLSGGAFATTAASLWGVPVIPSLAIAPGQALVGDWRQGATLYVREGVNVRLSDSDQDDFLRNRVTLLGEGRYALATWQPTCFCVVNFIA
jgi:HK97 family phage major capsid protein